MAKTLFELVQEYLSKRSLPETFTYDRSNETPVEETKTAPVLPVAVAAAMSP